jgi:hypothetical protein
MARSHTSTTHRPRFPISQMRKGSGRFPPARTRAVAIARDLQKLVHELLGRRPLAEEVLSVLNYERGATTTQIAIIVKRRLQDVCNTTRALERDGKIERRNNRWVRVEEDTP